MMLVESVTGGNTVFEGYDCYTNEDGKQLEPCTSSAVHKEYGRRDHLTENARWTLVYSKFRTLNSKGSN